MMGRNSSTLALNQQSLPRLGIWYLLVHSWQVV